MSGFSFPLTLPASWETAGSVQFWSSLDRKIRARLYIGRADGYTWVDMSDYLCTARINLGDVASIGTGSSGVDCVVRQAEFTLMNSRPDVDSLHPRDRASSWNLVGGVYTPLLWPGREVVFDVAACPIDREPVGNDWVRVFRGYMGDSIQASSDNGRITIQCRDQSKQLQKCYIETVRTYGSASGTPAETVIQQIIDDNLGVGKVTLYTPVSPGFMITPYQVEYQSVWDAIQQIATQIGWYLGYRWWPDINDFRLTFMAPPRYKTSAQYDFSLSWTDQIEVQELDITDRDVRNAVKVTYRDSSTQQRASVTREDSASIDEYGRMAMQIEEGDASLIDTAAEAQALADAALWDLKDLTATTRITMPLMPTMDVFSGILVTNPRLSSTQDFYAVESVEHVLDWSDKEQFRGSTEIVGSGRVVGAHGKWLQMQTRPGAAEPVRTGAIAPAAVDTTRLAAAAVDTDKIAMSAVNASRISSLAIDLSVQNMIIYEYILPSLMLSGHTYYQPNSSYGSGLYIDTMQDTSLWTIGGGATRQTGFLRLPDNSSAWAETTLGSVGSLGLKFKTIPIFIISNTPTNGLYCKARITLGAISGESSLIVPIVLITQRSAYVKTQDGVLRSLYAPWVDLTNFAGITGNLVLRLSNESTSGAGNWDIYGVGVMWIRSANIYR